MRGGMGGGGGGGGDGKRGTVTTIHLHVYAYTQYLDTVGEAVRAIRDPMDVPDSSLSSAAFSSGWEGWTWGGGGGGGGGGGETMIMESGQWQLVTGRIRSHTNVQYPKRDPLLGPWEPLTTAM